MRLFYRTALTRMGVFTAHPASFVIVAVYVVAWLIFDHEVMAPTAICRSK